MLTTFISWTSEKTFKTLQNIVNYLFRDKYTIQLWTDASNPSDLTIKTVAEKGFKMIFSNHDATYLDCGFGAWVRLQHTYKCPGRQQLQVGNGHNWCSPYKQWQAQHGNDPHAILELQVDPPLKTKTFYIAFP